jgi:iron(III) transport system substrate-binding protein
VAIAKPLYGTTLTHYVARWHAEGEALTRAWHEDWRRRGVLEVDGNARVKDLVAGGSCDLGLTDTDDALMAQAAGAPVWITPCELAQGQVIAIPNTVAIVAGTQRRAAAERLVDFLLSATAEYALASGQARQIPLGPLADPQLPQQVIALQQHIPRGLPLAELLPARTACLDWLRTQYR